ncbi:hypothetical protein [Jannaschia aquimarina]|uniref:Uncharacterized protein n=1 Tax=Jannaschia aquimarina TaxID=935700 RepID=A0A0D1EGA1_9RHOB|nr:hypothetical protein [Jannaschia aquimarina]KIT15946.1 hypothetical protein jaqu_22140 [Jannaschia aquimarina]SNS98424.1 hypothetical protein SAMN05421775_104125 [Jannaschia aquimarina]
MTKVVFPGMPVLALAALATAERAAAEPISFVDAESGIVHAELTFPETGDGQLVLHERWCWTDSRHCDPATLTMPASYRRFFDLNDPVPAMIELENDVSIILDIVAGSDARLGIGEPTMMGDLDFFRDYELMHGSGTTAPRPAERSSAIVELAADALHGAPMRVRLADNAHVVAPALAGYGSVIELPDGWCGEPVAQCPAFSIELPGSLLREWAHGTSEEAANQDDAFSILMDDFEFYLLRTDRALSVEVIQWLDNDRQFRQRFDGGEVVASAGADTGSTPAFDCSVNDTTAAGGAAFHVIREIDKACIGDLSWPDGPDPLAAIRMAPGWCGTDECGGIQLRSDSFIEDGTPRRFYEGQTNQPSLIIETGDAAWDGPVGLFASDGRVLARLVQAKDDTAGTPVTDDGPGERVAIADLPVPVGAYALVEGQTTLEGLGNRGDNLCLMRPTIFAGGGRVLFKTLGEPVDGNPYRTQEYLECSSFEGGPDACTKHAGTPDVPNPVGSGPGYEYTPLGGGDFTICPVRGEEPCALLYACVREGGAITVDRTMANGMNLIEAMIAPGGGVQSRFRYIDNTTLEATK